MDENKDEALEKADMRRKVVHVDLKAEILRLAERGKIPPEDLPKEFVITNYNYLRDLVKQYYAGRDWGYYEGVRDALASRWPWWAWLSIGLAGPIVAKLLMKLTVFLVLVYNS